MVGDSGSRAVVATLGELGKCSFHLDKENEPPKSTFSKFSSSKLGAFARPSPQPMGSDTLLGTITWVVREW